MQHSSCTLVQSSSTSHYEHNRRKVATWRTVIPFRNKHIRDSLHAVGTGRPDTQLPPSHCLWIYIYFHAKTQASTAPCYTPYLLLNCSWSKHEDVSDWRKVNAKFFLTQVLCTRCFQCQKSHNPPAHSWICPFISYFTITRKRKRMFVNGCECSSSLGQMLKNDARKNTGTSAE